MATRILPSTNLPDIDFISENGITYGDEFISDVDDNQTPSPWPAQCSDCGKVLANREEAERHRDETDQDFGAHEKVDVPIFDEQRRMIEHYEPHYRTSAAFNLIIDGVEGRCVKSSLPQESTAIN